MRYKNVKTGAIIDSPFKIEGKNWVEVTDEKEGIKRETAAEEQQNTHYEEEIDLEQMTKAQLLEFAGEHDIKVSEKDTKAVIIETIAKVFE